MKKLLLIFFVFNAGWVWCQSVLDYKITPNDTGKSLITLMNELESQYEVRFYYRDEWLKHIQLKTENTYLKLSDALELVFSGTDLNFFMMNDHAVIIVKDPSQLLKKSESLSRAFNSGKKITTVKVGEAGSVSPSATVKLSGKVIAKEDSKPLAGATVMATDINKGISTDANGEFLLNIPSGVHSISISSVNFEDKYIDLEIFSDGSINIDLEEAPHVLEDIIVTDRAGRAITTSAIGQTQIIMKEVKRAPAMLGEVDIIKQIQTLAGVTTAGEAASGYNVRGGSVDQNLILYDGQPVFNSSHVFGFFSTFNAEAIRDVNFYRGGIPAEYGGRASSVLDIRSREGNFEKWKASAGIGFVSSNVLVEGPIFKDKTSIIASIRTTYSDWLINTVKSNYVDLNKSTVKFYDDAFKLTHKFSSNSKLTASWYGSNDKFRLRGDSTYSWDTKLSSLRLDQVFSPKFSGIFSLGYGEYSYKVYDKNPFNGFNLFYKILYPSFKSDFLYNAGNYKISFGLQSTYYGFNPGSFKPSAPTSVRSVIEIEKQNSIESGVYASGQFHFTKKLFVDIGFRYSFFQAMGPGSVNIYAEGVTRETTSLIDTLKFNKGKLIKQYSGFEPRLGIRYELSEKASIKLGYNRLYQYLHLVTNTTAVTPVDIWQPSGYYFKPQQADQISLGYFFNFKEKMYDAFIETYYKMIKNVLDFKDGAQLLLNKHLETDLLQGKSKAYGIEMQVSKVTGMLTGSVSYTYSRSLRTIQGRFEDETINSGKEYASNFDQPHNINLQWKYGFTRRHFFTGGFTYRTGRPITLPLNAYEIDNITVTSFSERNKFRIPDYHRLDVGIVIEGNHKRKKIFDGTWTFSIYNVYGRRNAYTIFFKEVRPGILRPYRLAVIGTALPSISYSIKI